MKSMSAQQFSYPWPKCHFSDKFERVTRKNKDGNSNVLTISAQQGLINQFEYYNHQYASEDTSGYTLLKQGEFAYNKSYSESQAWGALKRLEHYDSGIVSPLYICFAPKEGVCAGFYKQYFEAGLFNREIYKIAQEGARNHGLLNVSTEDFFKAMLADPPLPEQRKIAEILECCDEVIRLKKALITEKKKQKKALMQKLLDPNSGFRLPGFEGEWRNKKLKTICKINGDTLGETTSPKFVFRYIDLSMIDHGKLIENPELISFEIAPCRARRCFKYGDILFSTVRPYLQGFLLVDFDADEYIASTGFSILSSLYGNSNEFIYHQLFSYGVNLQIKNLLTGTNYPALNGQDVGNLIFAIPPTQKEQQAIADILSAADQEIDLLEQELEQQEKKKKSLMQLLLTGIVGCRYGY